MKLLKLILSSIIVTCLASCGGGGSSTTSTPTVPSSIPRGAIVSINPEIEFTSELTLGSPATAIYSNTDATYFPVSAEESVTVNMESTSSTITISFKLASGKSIQLIISDLTDLEDDGFYDEYTVDAKVDGTTVLNARGYFPGIKKPVNSSASNPVNINRAPTEEEFKKYVAGYPLYYNETYPDPGDDGYAIFNKDFSITDFDRIDDNDEPDDEISTWEYDYNGGSPKLTLRSKSKSSSHYHHDIFRLKFTTFYEGEIEQIYDEEDNKISTDPKDMARLTFQIFTNVPDGWVEQKKL